IVWLDSGHRVTRHQVTWLNSGAPRHLARQWAPSHQARQWALSQLARQRAPGHQALDRLARQRASGHQASGHLARQRAPASHLARQWAPSQLARQRTPDQVPDHLDQQRASSHWPNRIIRLDQFIRAEWRHQAE
ncbi:unnamed protein product, partial [Staurois parvus]